MFIMIQIRVKIELIIIIILDFHNKIQQINNLFQIIRKKYLNN